MRKWAGILLATSALTFAVTAGATVTGTSSRVEYTGNGSTKVFAFTFSTKASTHVKVYLGGTLVSTGYSVALNSDQTVNPGGSVTFTSAPGSSVAVRIQREEPLTAETVYPTYGQYQSRVIERDFDSRARQVQQVDRRVADLEAKEAADLALEATYRAGGDVADQASIAALGAQLRAEMAADPGAEVLDERTVQPFGATTAYELQDLFANTFLGVPGYVNVRWLGARCIEEPGYETFDSTTYIQAAIDSGAAHIEFPPNCTLLTSAQLNVNHRSNITLYSLGNRYATTIRYIGPVSSSVAIIKIRRSSHVTVKGLFLTSRNGTDPDDMAYIANSRAGFGIYMTGDDCTSYPGDPFAGTGANTVQDTAVWFTTQAGIQIGNIGDPGLDCNTDENAVYDSTTAFNGNGVRVYQINTNMTRMVRVQSWENLASGFEIAKGARNVTIETPYVFMNGYQRGGQEFLIGVLNQGPIRISDTVSEIYDTTWLRALPTDGGVNSFNNLTLTNINFSANLTAGYEAIRLIDYQGAGSVVIQNCRFAGGGTTTPWVGGTLYFAPTNASQTGPLTLTTINVDLINGASFDVPGNLNAGTAWMRWVNVGTITKFTGSGGPIISQEGPFVRYGPTLSVQNTTMNGTSPEAKAVTPGSYGHVGQTTFKMTIPYTSWTAAATTQDIYFVGLPAKTRIVAAYLDTTVAYAGLAGTIELNMSQSGTGDLLLSHDVKTAAVVKGLVAGDLGTSLTTGLVQGAFIPNWNGAVNPFLRLTSGTGNIGTGTVTNLTAGSTTLYLITETFP